MFGNTKNAIWEAFLLTVVIFIFGLLVGAAYEMSNFDKMNEYYTTSENSLMDILALNNLIDSENSTCNVLITSNLDFADRIYKEAKILENYESSGKISENMKLIHTKYDILRTFLWISNNKVFEKCPKEFSSVVYLYEYNSQDLAQKATQNVWSKILFDLKQEKGEKIILIPIAVDTNIISLETLIKKFNISNYPVVIINNKKIITKLESVDELKKEL